MAGVDGELRLQQARDVRVFVKLANLTQTKELHAWNLESLRRALQWAQLAEDVVAPSSSEHVHEHRQEQEARIRRWFPVAALPTLPSDSSLTAGALRYARRHLLRAVLQSPFLASHPIRSELLAATLQELRRLEKAPGATNGDAWAPQTPLSALLTERVASAPRTDALLAIAEQMNLKCKRIPVRVLSGSASIRPLQSYKFSPRTLQLKSLAKTLQRNAVDARAAVDPDTYRTFLQDLRTCFGTSDSDDVREVVALMLVVCEWPKEEPEQLRGMMADLERTVRDWAAPEPARFFSFPPWLVAMLAAKFQSLAAIYIPELFRTGFLQPCKDTGGSEFSERVATLLMHDDGVAVEVERSLSNLDPHLLQKHFNISPSGLKSPK